MVRRALSNLLSNALRHADAGSTITVHIAAETEQVSVAVSNQGEPIDPTVVPRLFDRFFRADRSRYQADAEGAGLGLPIVAAIMSAHGGTAGVQSSGRTTEVTLVFPVHARADQA
jgi:two-component system heavy metal sensor histidine kinase CusS